MNYNYQDAKMESQQEYLGTAHINNTDEEMAQQFADNLDGYELTCSLLLAKDKNQVYKIGRYDGFLAGLKAGRSEWHVADSPKQDGLYYCKIKSVVGIPYYRETEFINGQWNIVMGKIIAWCEMPKYEEASNDNE